MARGASEPALAGAIAAARLHLLDMAHRLVPRPVGPLEDREEVGGQESRPVVERAAAGSLDPMAPQDVALLTDGFAKRPREMPRIDDRHVLTVDDLLPK